ncbi:signal transduction histidine kinase [Filimonas zeae]|uniref:Oxygen sensor histidine kinase NreB n=1 Tax=Filimonas zeae TaxID=1737353 RepID=A0A917MYC7_9BACT|nr:ATP-binding protein [Filimonas zeae]MDR6340965.1 signal transduction histidine kinase [Filimonas zeae]GGH77762.1 hypothetical protein GCM10011379_44600 [Filimonas zeae]
MHQTDLHNLKNQYEHTLLQSQLEIQEQTFRNISQEIHDNIGQVLSLAKLNLNTINEANFREKLEVTDELVGKAIADLRDLSRSLNGEKITDLGLYMALEHELAIIEKTVAVKTILSGDDIDELLNEEQVIILFRMMQELLNNILKHANAGCIEVALQVEEKCVRISIKDDGKGFDLSQLDPSKTGIGLKNLEQRARLINGQLDIKTAPGAGTEVTISLQPLKDIFAV